MNSTNFDVLQKSWPELSILGGFAEQYAYPDPSSALVKLRSFAEAMVSRIYQELNLPQPMQPNLYELIENPAFTGAIPKVVIDKLHALRIHGNKAAHGDPGSTEKALWLLKEAFDLGCWFHVTCGGGALEDCPKYQPPSPGVTDEAKTALKTEKRAILQRLAAQEAQMEQLLRDIEALRQQKESPKKEPRELQVIVDAGRSVAESLHFDEETTRRRLIDSLLATSGWRIGENGQETDEVREEQRVFHQPTQTGSGFADYVLWDDNGKPLAVIEAKKTSKSADVGRNQARYYADGLEKMHEQRPVIFYTNGYDVWMWDDFQGYPPRKLFGFYSKDNLQYLVNFQRRYNQPLDSIAISPAIIDRLYQFEAVKHVTERFMDRHRKALIVQATGTGKTRVAIALADVLIRANWARRVLFLCDRRELRKQAKDAFKEFLNEPLVVVGASTARDRDKRIYLATYPAMMKVYQDFDVGFFDLIIADESHRSIYNRYRGLFEYFDCLQVGLTATPVDQIQRNTFNLFGCEEKSPTYYYPLKRAIDEGYLVPYEVYSHTTRFLRMGIKYKDLSVEQRRQLEEEGEDPQLFNYEASQIDKEIYNKETNRAILRNLMENGIRDATGQHPGKTIIFARSHNHAVLLRELFDELYPQYAGTFCQVIDNYDPMAEQLIDDFKGLSGKTDLTIAISVDMLDTGIDVPEIVNLVFAKPVFSHVKFQQMIGRGTRLCKDLFGPGKDKTIFRIFDHWGNFDYFDENYTEAEPIRSRSLMERLFEARIDLAEAALALGNEDDFSKVIDLIQKDLASLPEESIPVREKWREKREVSRREALDAFSPATVAVLRKEMAPLMQWVNIRKDAPAYEFDLLVAHLQLELLKQSGRFDDHKVRLMRILHELPAPLDAVQARQAVIRKLQDKGFWTDVTLHDLEEVRQELRDLMLYLPQSRTSRVPPKVIDIADGQIQYEHRPTRLQEVEMRAYRVRVEEVLRSLFDTNPTLQKIRTGKPVTESDLNALVSLVLTQHPGVDLNVLKEFYPETAPPLDFIIRTIIGMDADAVRERFAQFVRRHPGLNAKQLRFMSLLQNHISLYGAIEIDRLYEPPFTTVDSEGPDGVFESDAQINELIAILETFQFKPKGVETLQ